MYFYMASVSFLSAMPDINSFFWYHQKLSTVEANKMSPKYLSYLF